MIKVKAIEEFTLGKFKELKNIKRADETKNEDGQLHIGDVFECDTEMTDYLLGNNDKNKVVIEIIEVIPDPVAKTIKIPKVTKKTKK